MKVIPLWVELRKKQSWLWGTFLNLIYCWLTWSFDYWFGYWERKNNTQNPQRRRQTFRETPFLLFFMLSLSHKLPLPWLVPAWAEVPQAPPPAAVLGGGRQFASVSPLVGTGRSWTPPTQGPLLPQTLPVVPDGVPTLFWSLDSIAEVSHGALEEFGYPKFLCFWCLWPYRHTM